MRSLIAIVGHFGAFPFVVGCGPGPARAEEVAGPDNSRSQLITCEGQSAECYSKAAKECPDGYELLSSNTRTSTATSPGMSTAHTTVVGGTTPGAPVVVQRSQLELLVRCKGGGSLQWNDKPPPDGAIGYTFDGDSTASKAACERQGHAWSESASGALCDGLPAALALDGRVGIGFCDGHVCKVDVIGTLPSRLDTQWLDKLYTLKDQLTTHYGPPVRVQRVIPDECGADKMMDCIATRKASFVYTWKWPTGAKILLALTADGGAPILRVTYEERKTEAPAAPADRL